MVDTMGQTETADNGVLDNTTTSLRAGKRGYVLLEDTIVRKKMLHFDRERAPERVVHALGHAAYGNQPQRNCANLLINSQQAPLHPLETGATSHLHAGCRETPLVTFLLVSRSLWLELVEQTRDAIHMGSLRRYTASAETMISSETMYLVSSSTMVLSSRTWSML
jgi:hypothetical protein